MTVNTYRIAMMPAGDITAASARLRCHFLREELVRLGVDAQVTRTPIAADVLFVQKRIDAAAVAMATAIRRDGGLVIYDIDDYGPGLAWLNTDPVLEQAFLAQVDLLVVDTDERLEVFGNDPRYAHIPARMVVPDPVDYLPWAGTGKQWRERSDRPVAGWFGNAINLPPAIPHLSALAESGQVSRVDVITGAAHIADLARRYPFAHLVPWHLEAFADLLRGCDFVVLVHDTDTEGIQKSNNKMLAALGLGVVPFVSDTPAYRRTAAEIGLPELVFENVERLVKRLSIPGELERLRHALQAERCQTYLHRFHPATVAGFFNHCVQQLLGALRTQHAD